jgi:hypothetical protein
LIRDQKPQIATAPTSGQYREEGRALALATLAMEGAKGLLTQWPDGDTCRYLTPMVQLASDTWNSPGQLPCDGGY